MRSYTQETNVILYSPEKPKFKMTRDDKAPSCSARRREHRDNLEIAGIKSRKSKS